eukprot:9004522-Alexandrium_andersonii.AAC.1
MAEVGLLCSRRSGPVRGAAERPWGPRPSSTSCAPSSWGPCGATCTGGRASRRGWPPPTTT